MTTDMPMWLIGLLVVIGGHLDGPIGLRPPTEEPDVTGPGYGLRGQAQGGICAC
jgi:hypothetical protein